MNRTLRESVDNHQFVSPIGIGLGYRVRKDVQALLSDISLRKDREYEPLGFIVATDLHNQLLPLVKTLMRA
jgi:hypothetical protein